jgi:adenylate cyclase class 2
MIEVERKYRLKNDQVDNLRKQLEAFDPKITDLHQVDTVYLRGINSFKDFESGMSVVRLRSEGIVDTLTYKKALNQAGDSVEHEVVVSDAQKMDQILRAEDYRQVTKVIKDRSEAHYQNLTYALDNVQKLGWFIEIESLIEDTADLKKAENAIMAAAAKLSLSEDMIETKKYDQLISAQ